MGSSFTASRRNGGNFELYLQKMALNEIEEMLDHLRRIKNRRDLYVDTIDEIEILEMELRFWGTFIKYHHVLLPDSLVKLVKNAKLIVRMLYRVFDGIPDEC
ncbi:hypothetical protein H5410_049230 [Solanum commersonii]|uniref:Uncharacterized protein n=1 Tax=Solanum commersonii TaxID=4109 RepID=A0A9J5XN78_SOLCO|nr:hypothetical protein H5410_049230 [Solanum commersonii]